MGRQGPWIRAFPAPINSRSGRLPSCAKETSSELGRGPCFDESGARDASCKGEMSQTVLGLGRGGEGMVRDTVQVGGDVAQVAGQS